MIDYKVGDKFYLSGELEVEITSIIYDGCGKRSYLVSGKSSSKIIFDEEDMKMAERENLLIRMK